MPSSAKKSYGPKIKERARTLLQTILEAAAYEREIKSGWELRWNWAEDDKHLTIETTLRTLVLLSQPEVLSEKQAGESLKDLRDFVGILADHRVQRKGVNKWHFSLQLWGKDIDRNLAEFDKLWESKRSPAAKQTPIPEPPGRSPIKPGAPFPQVRLPENFVPRPDALNAVKAKLLAEDERTLVVSAISGLGGLGKSVLAAALVQDVEVQQRFEDGILWVPLGQNPDLQTLLGNWIRELDKSREAFSVNTREAASRYLHNLLAERRVLLVVDDVWNVAHAKWFRVGGAGCRVLVTTRTVVIPGAEKFGLSLMTSDESVALMRGELGKQWTADMEQPARELAKLLGYLPLALKLMAVQVARGRKWEMLKKAFLREAKRLKSLDYPGVKLGSLSEDERREYSLRSCFGLSLQWLDPELLERFLWLGILPEDAVVQQKMAMPLWDVEDWEAEAILLSLYENSLLTAGITTIEGEPTYRVHDLLHQLAQEILEHPQHNQSAQNSESIIQNLPGLGLTLIEAQRQFLERYQQRTTDGCWHKLPNDGYIHQHLTWHLEQADWVEEVHALMAMSDEQGRNAWFEACDRIGQPAIFVDDVARGWRLAEAGYEQEATQSIVWQCRYALITATLNSLVADLPIGMMAEFVKRDFWAVEQAWAYVEQMQYDFKAAEAIQALAPYLSKTLFQIAIQKARALQDDYHQAKVLTELAKQDETYFDEALKCARQIQNDYYQAEVLTELAKQNGTYFNEALKYTQQIQNEDNQAIILGELAKQDGADLAAILECARNIQDERYQARALSELAKQDGLYLDEAIECACNISNNFSRAFLLNQLIPQDRTYFEEALQCARQIQNEYFRAYTLSKLAQQDRTYFEEALQCARTLEDTSSRACVLSKLAQQDRTYFDEALQCVRTIPVDCARDDFLSALAKQDKADLAAVWECARNIRDEHYRARVLRELAQQDETYFDEALQCARTIQDESYRAEAVRELAQRNGAYFDEALQYARTIQDTFGRACALSKLSKLDRTYFDEALQNAGNLQDDELFADVLSELAQQDGADLAAVLECTRTIQDEQHRAQVLRKLAQQDGADLSAILECAHIIQDKYYRARVLSKLASKKEVYFKEALQNARTIQNEYHQANALIELVKQDGSYFDEALECIYVIQDESSRAKALISLAKLDGADTVAIRECAHTIQDESSRADVLCKLNKQDGADLATVLEYIHTIQDESSLVYILGELAKRLDVFSEQVKQDNADLHLQIWKAILNSTHGSTGVETLRSCLPHLPITALSHSDWKTSLHLFASGYRSTLMQDLATLYPAITHLGGETAMRGVVDAMREVCSQWK